METGAGLVTKCVQLSQIQHDYSDCFASQLSGYQAFAQWGTEAASASLVGLSYCSTALGCKIVHDYNASCLTRNMVVGIAVKCC